MENTKYPLINHPSKAAPDVQRQEPANVYVDLTTGKVCADRFEQTANQEQENPDVEILTDPKAESWKLAKPYRPQSGDRTKAQVEQSELRRSDVADGAQLRAKK